MKGLRLYLNDPAHCDAWVNGGRVPINPASTYLSNVRKGTRTPDENRQFRYKGIPEALVNPNMGWVPFTVGDNTSARVSDVTIVTSERFDYIEQAELHSRIEDGLILSFSRERVPQWREEGKRACVRIVNFYKLLASANRGLRQTCVHKGIDYTEKAERNHFLKSDEDQWQCEYRMFWKRRDPVETWIHIPPGIAEICDL